MIVEPYTQDGIVWFVRQGDPDDKYAMAEVKTYAIGEGPVRTCIDIGAHIGTFTCLIKHLYPFAIVHAYEPAPDNFEMLQRNVGRFNGSVVAYANPVGYSLEQPYVAFHPDHSTCHRAGPRDSLPAGLKMEKALPFVTLGEVITRMDRWPIDILKIDAEGAEVDIFEHCTDESILRVKRFVGEFHNGFDAFMSTIGARFKGLGYEVWAERDPQAHATFWAVRL